MIQIAGGAALADEDEEGVGASRTVAMRFWPTASAPLATMLWLSRASFRHAPIVLIEDRVMLRSDRLRLTIVRRR